MSGKWGDDWQQLAGQPGPRAQPSPNIMWGSRCWWWYGKKESQSDQSCSSWKYREESDSAWSSIPLDNLLLRLQHLDAAGEAVNLVT